MISEGRLQKVLGDWTCVGRVPVYALYRKSSRVSANVTAFLEFVGEAVAAFDPEQVTLTRDAAFLEAMRRA